MEKINKKPRAAIPQNQDIKIRITKKKSNGSKKMKSSSVKTLQAKQMVPNIMQLAPIAKEIKVKKVANSADVNSKELKKIQK